GGEIKTLKTNRPEVMIIPRIIELDRKAAPTLKLSLRAVPSVSIRGKVRWADSEPVPRLMILSGFYPPGDAGIHVDLSPISTDADGMYEVKVPKGIEGFFIMVSATREGSPHPVGKKPGRQHHPQEMHFDRLDESIDGVDWEMRVNETPKAPAPKQTMAPGKAELREFDRAAVERMNSLRKQAEKAKPDKERIGLWRLLHLGGQSADGRRIDRAGKTLPMAFRRGKLDVRIGFMLPDERHLGKIG
ncbi:MAG TPA: hypothetical protein VH575_02875, partial [Gemmataceae bacterium]